MKRSLSVLCFLSSVLCLTAAQPEPVQKDSVTNRVTESFKVPSGKTLTIETGATLDATGATLVGLSTGGTWGSITGTLSSQTDLQAALNAKLTTTVLDGYFADPSTHGSFSASAWRSDLGLVIGTNVQAYDADLSTYAGITPSANVQTLLGAADYSAFRTSLGLVIGTNVQAYDADLTTYAGITPSANAQSLLGAANYAAMRALLDLEVGTDFLAYPTGTPTGSKYLRDDNSWQTISGGGDALVANPLTQFNGILPTNTEFNYVDGVTSAIQAQLDTKTTAAAALSAAAGIKLDDFATPDDNTDLNASTSRHGLMPKLNSDGTYIGQRDVWIVAVSDETTVLTTGTAKVTFRAPRAATLTAVRASVTTASTSGTPTFDLNEGGTTVLSTKLTIDADEKTSTTAAAAAVISDSALANDAELTVDIDVAGTNTTGGKLYLFVTY